MFFLFCLHGKIGHARVDLFIAEVGGDSFCPVARFTVCQMQEEGRRYWPRPHIPVILYAWTLTTSALSLIFTIKEGGEGYTKLQLLLIRIKHRF
jgi:hypothetical protein